MSRTTYFMIKKESFHKCLIVFLRYRKNFVGTQKRVRIIQGKRAIGVRAIEVLLYCLNIWAATWENVLFDMCAQRRLKSACASAQTDKSLRCSHDQTFHPWLSKMRPVKILIRLRECADWSESSLGAHVRRYVFWVCGSILWYQFQILYNVMTDAFSQNWTFWWNLTSKICELRCSDQTACVHGSPEADFIESRSLHAATGETGLNNTYFLITSLYRNSQLVRSIRLLFYANVAHKGSDQHTHLRSQIKAFCIHCFPLYHLIT